MDQSSSLQVEIDFSPEVPKTQPEMLVSVAMASRVVYDALAAYVNTGSADAARRAANALLFMSSMSTKVEFRRMLSTLIRGEHSLTENQREEAKEDIYQHG